MASNRLPTRLPELFTLVEDMLDGLATLEGPVGIKQNGASVLGAALAAARDTQNAFAQGRAAKPADTTATTVADSNAKAFLAAAVAVLKPRLGAAWSPAWIPVGFANGSLALPATVGERQELLKAVGAYLAAQPAHENAPLEITAVRAQALFDALSASRSAVNNRLGANGALKAARDAAVETLRTRARGLVSELDTLLSEDDPRWYAFGLNPPAAPATPETPDGLVATAGPAGSGTLYLDWDDAPRAERYRVWTLPAGATEWTAAAAVDDSDATLAGLPPGGALKVRVTAVNEAGESPASAELAATVG